MVRRPWWAAVALGVLLVAGCANPVAGSAEVDPADGGQETSMTSSSGDSSAGDQGAVASGDEADLTSSEGGGPSITDTSASESADTTPVSESAPDVTSLPAAEPEVTERTKPAVMACGDAASWTTAEKTAALAGNVPIRMIDIAAGDCYDTFVIEIGPDAHDPGYLVRYVDEITQDGSGFVVPVAGAAKLEVIVDSPAYDPTTGIGTLQIPDHDHVVDASGLTVVKQVAFAGSFEGQTKFGIGVAAKVPFSVSTGFDNAGNATLTIAIAHQ